MVRTKRDVYMKCSNSFRRFKFNSQEKTNGIAEPCNQNTEMYCKNGTWLKRKWNHNLRDLKAIRYIGIILLFLGLSCQKKTDIHVYGDDRLLSMLRSDRMNILKEKKLEDLIENKELKVFIRMWIFKPLQSEEKCELHSLEIYDHSGFYHNKTLCCGNYVLPFNDKIENENATEYPTSKLVKLEYAVSGLKWEEIKTSHKEVTFDGTNYLTEIMFRSDVKTNYIVVMGMDSSIGPIYKMMSELVGESVY
jgi:hypothetical protein